MGDRGGMNHSAGKQDRTKLALMGGLAVILIAVGVRTFSSGPEQAAASTDAAAESGPANGSSGASRSLVHVPRVIDWPAKAARDPFASSTVYQPPPPPPKPDEPPPPPPPPVVVDLAKEAVESIPLTATVVGDKPIAMINGRIYRVGEYVAGFRISEIHARRIVVERNNQSFAIDVKQ